MRKILKIGISKPLTINTLYCCWSHRIDNKIHYGRYITVKGLEKIGNCLPLSQSRIKGLHRQAEESALEEITECIQLCEEVAASE